MSTTTTQLREAAIAAPVPPAARRPRRRDPGSAGWVAYLLLALTAFVFLVPFYYMVVAASRPMAEMNVSPPPLLPGGDLWSNIQKAMEQQDLVKAIVNSTIVSGAVTVSTALFCTLAGFAFAKLRFSGKNVLFGIAIGTMMIPPTLGVVPLYKLMSDLELTGRLASVILPFLVSAFGVFFMRQYLVQSLPDELIEAARIDGASSLRTFWSIVLPIARPGMAVLGMLTFMTMWNEFFWPVIALNSSNPTVQVALANLGSGYVPDQSIILAGTLVGTVPVLVVFALLGRQIVNGILAGAVKG
ncbi:carbohydrate ABC transporter permease [Vallicoccus soli]|uniref:Carbohydrate ABC transporter permease n=1 Tax=Vallicoccus soli TaxID=2339232 RepID=A0A3A3ZL14_9ACTN|nr:carbohydrate ABC transporter permease [Vallicoccus soli]RJK96806.1 carbohydrate ABC transporter permease [Vallicoccus soli]